MKQQPFAATTGCSKVAYFCVRNASMWDLRLVCTVMSAAMPMSLSVLRHQFCLLLWSDKHMKNWSDEKTSLAIAPLTSIWSLIGEKPCTMTTPRTVPFVDGNLLKLWVGPVALLRVSNWCALEQECLHQVTHCVHAKPHTGVLLLTN